MSEMPNAASFIGPDEAVSAVAYSIPAGHALITRPISNELSFLNKYFDRGPQWYRDALRVRDGLCGLDITHDYHLESAAKGRTHAMLCPQSLVSPCHETCFIAAAPLIVT